MEAVLQPNPSKFISHGTKPVNFLDQLDERLEDFILTKLDQKGWNKPNIYEQLGHCMCEAGNDFGPSTQYGNRRSRERTSFSNSSFDFLRFDFNQVRKLSSKTWSNSQGIHPICCDEFHATIEKFSRWRNENISSNEIVISFFRSNDQRNSFFF